MLNYSRHDVVNFTNLDLFPFLFHRSPLPHSSLSLQNGCIPLKGYRKNDSICDYLAAPCYGIIIRRAKLAVNATVVDK